MPEINYFWDEIEDNVVEEYDENGVTTGSYTTEPTLYGSVLSQDRNGEKRYFQCDGQGNTTELTNQYGDTTDTRRHTAFGLRSFSTGITQLSFEFGGAFGYMADASHEQVSVRRRTYGAKDGRWRSTDPIIRDREIANRYNYVENRASVDHDPSGLQHLRLIRVESPAETCNVTAAPKVFLTCKKVDSMKIIPARPCAEVKCPIGYQCHHDPGKPPKRPFKTGRVPQTFCVKCGCIPDPDATANDWCCFSPECTSTSGVGPLNSFRIACRCIELV